MKRFIDFKLQAWKTNKNRKPLILRGPRQVGKTYAVKQLGETEFAGNRVVLDLEKYPAYHRIFERDLEVKRILAELELVLHQKIEIGKTLLFLDEIQSCPRAIMALRYFYEECPDLHVIAAGSLLEFTLGTISFPVGRVQFLEMGPMTFFEFLWAIGKNILAESLLKDPVEQTPSSWSPFAHELFLEDLRRYFLVGGMPEAVAAYVRSGSYQDSFAVHRELVAAYRDDFAKYSPRVDVGCLDAVFQGVATQVGQAVKYTRLAEGYSQPTLKKAFDLLCQARLVKKVQSASPAGLPLRASANPKIFKAIVLDIGLMNELCGLSQSGEWEKASLLSLYRGAMAEQFVGQELAAVQDGLLYYWLRAQKGSEAEVDYLIAKDSMVYPIEVKSGAAGRLKSLHLLLQQFPNCKTGLVLSEASPSRLDEQRLQFIPLYYAFACAGGEGKLD